MHPKKNNLKPFLSLTPPPFLKWGVLNLKGRGRVGCFGCRVHLPGPWNTWETHRGEENGLLLWWIFFGAVSLSSFERRSGHLNWLCHAPSPEQLIQLASTQQKGAHHWDQVCGPLVLYAWYGVFEWVKMIHTLCPIITEWTVHFVLSRNKLAQHSQVHTKF